jgi:hypothetical protein
VVICDKQNISVVICDTLISQQFTMWRCWPSNCRSDNPNFATKNHYLGATLSRGYSDSKHNLVFKT